MFNYILIVSIGAMGCAQFIKLFTVYFVEKRWNLGVLISTGGMPSSHTTLVTTLALSIALVEGVDDTLFAIAFVLALVVTHDAMGIRYEAGRHASILNEMLDDIKTRISKPEHTSEKLKELLGHKPIEVVVGFGLGVFISVASYFLIFPFFN